MVKTFRIRSESSSSYESVEDVEFKQLKGEQAEVDYLHVLIIYHCADQQYQEYMNTPYDQNKNPFLNGCD
jgi:hypothetical protein